jgi:hypothetical protein
LLDDLQGAPRRADRVNGGHQITASQGEVGRLDRDVGTGAYRQAVICLRQRGGVVVTPSPTIATTLPASCRRLTTSTLSSSSA